jgi:hypothetical protein
MWFTIQWLTVSIVFVLTFYAVLHDVSDGNHDRLEVLWSVLASAAFISSVLSGVAVWGVRARGK